METDTTQTMEFVNVSETSETLCEEGSLEKLKILVEPLN